MAFTIDALSRSLAIFSMNLRSILTPSKHSRRRWSKVVAPAPKSSSTIRSPASRSMPRLTLATSRSAAIAASVISSSRRCSENFELPTMRRMRRPSVSSRSCTGEMLKESPIGAGQHAASSQALRRSWSEQRVDQPALLGERNEAVRRDRAQRRMGPARECLEGPDSPARKLDDAGNAARSSYPPSPPRDRGSVVPWRAAPARSPRRTSRDACRRCPWRDRARHRPCASASTLCGPARGSGPRPPRSKHCSGRRRSRSASAGRWRHDWRSWRPRPHPPRREGPERTRRRRCAPAYRTPGGRRTSAGNDLEDGVAPRVAVQVVDLLEAVQIEQEQGARRRAVRRPRARRPVRLAARCRFGRLVQSWSARCRASASAEIVRAICRSCSRIRRRPNQTMRPSSPRPRTRSFVAIHLRRCQGAPLHVEDIQ